MGMVLVMITKTQVCSLSNARLVNESDYNFHKAYKRNHDANW